MKLSSSRGRVQNVAAYVRVSSESQTGAMQRDAIARASSARSDDVARAMWFEETASAATIKRPVLDRLRQLIREGWISRLYVWRLDRVCRSGPRDALDFVDEMRRHGCEVVSLTDPFDVSSPTGEAMLLLAAWFAKTELALIAERRAAARARILAEGGTWGRPRRTTDATEARVLALREQRRSIRAISVALKIPRATVGRICARLKSTPQTGAAKAPKKPARRQSVPPPSH